MDSHTASKITDTAIVIAAWNQLEKTLVCLRSLSASQPNNFDIILVDNGSREPLAPDIQREFPQMTILRNDQNLGFSGGYNIGLRYALNNTSYTNVLLLNNDTVMRDDCIALLQDQLNGSQSDIAGVIPKIYYAGDPTRIWTVGFNFRPHLKEVVEDQKGMVDVGQWNEVREIDAAPFCAILLRRSIIEKIGLLDDRFFLYYEDLDYCQRLNQAGYRLKYIPQAELLHDVSFSSGGEASPITHYWLASSSSRYFRKHGGVIELLFLIVPYRLGSAVRKSLKFLARREWQALSHHWAGLYHGWTSSA